MTALLVGLVSAALLVAAALAWSGRWRAWARQQLMFTFPLHMYPALGLTGLIAVANERLDGRVHASMSLLAVPILILGAVGVIAVFWRAPRWAVPTWYHDEAEREPDLSDPATAVLTAIGQVETRQPSMSRIALDQAIEGQHRSLRWQANWIHDPSPEATLAHGASAGYGAIGGHLAGYESGLGFTAVFTEVGVLGSASDAMFIPAQEMEAVWTVGRSAGVDGALHHVSLVRRLKRPELRRRLVLRMRDHVLVFGVYSARRRADSLATRYGIERLPDA